MKGICHKCFESDIELFIDNGLIRCEDCREVVGTHGKGRS